tara:strand:+ start:8696 stop:9487 length:792 start_codon:yes stop_codon:yes gene_type:complete
MAVNKNFVVKNGIEVATDLIYATSDLDKVGIGSTIPTSTLEVGGDFKATGNSTLVGFATVQDTFDVGVGGTVITADVQAGRIGLNTATPGYNVHISNVGSGSTTLYVDGGDVKIAGDIYADNLALPGGSITVDNLTVQGFSTFVNSLNIDGDVDLDANLHLTGVSTFVGDISITGNVLQTGIITATAFHGDGSNLTGIATQLTATIGIKSEGTVIGSGITQIDFASSNGSGIAVDIPPATAAGVATVTVTTGISIGLAIALGG